MQELYRRADTIRDELAAWAAYYQQQVDPLGTPEKLLEEGENNQVPNSFITTMARQGDTKIEVAKPDYFPAGKHIVVQESLIYLLVDKGSLVLDRPLSRDFLSGTNVR